MQTQTLELRYNAVIYTVADN